jgi:hypothetical protein
MRVVNSIEFGGVEYQAIWASLSWINDDPAGSAAMALVIRSGDGQNETTIHRNARLADVQASLRHLRGLGLKDSFLGQLFNYKGDKNGLAKHVRTLVSSLR